MGQVYAELVLVEREWKYDIKALNGETPNIACFKRFANLDTHRACHGAFPGCWAARSTESYGKAGCPGGPHSCRPIWTNSRV